MSATEYVLELRSRKEIENHDRGRKGGGILWVPMTASIGIKVWRSERKKE